MLEEDIIRLIEDRGPLTGSEILENTGGDGLILWRTCRLSDRLVVRTIGTRYVRLDRNVEGFARLSPSILREFLTYTVVGTRENTDLIEKRVQDLMFHIEEVSRSKLELAYRVVSGLAGSFENEAVFENGVCCIIAGDIVYNMAHDVPRPERSTGKMVTGSDMDLVIVADDAFPDDLMKKLDDALYQEKYRLLMAPHLKEEIDYIVKHLNRVREQIRFETFRQMVACKILYEGTLLYGSDRLFSTIKGMLRENGIAGKLNVLEKRAGIFRRDAENYLLREDPQKILSEKSCLFYPTEESEEFE